MYMFVNVLNVESEKDTTKSACRLQTHITSLTCCDKFISIRFVNEEIIAFCDTLFADCHGSRHASMSSDTSVCAS